MSRRVLLTGATGFVGRHLHPSLVAAGHSVRSATRRPEEVGDPDREWVRLDLHDGAGLEPALREIDVVYYLVHGMAEGQGYRQREHDAAERLVAAAADAGVSRIVYLGGVAPQGPPSEHLESRLETGRILRAGAVPCLELRASMIIGAGSASWKICRDLAARLPFMLLPKWLQSRTEPVGIDDVVAALSEAAVVSDARSTVYDLPGPETVRAEEILLRIAAQRGTRPRTLHVPLLTPRLSSYWLRFVSGADFSVARELVLGLENDLVSTNAPFWDRMPGYERQSLDDAIRSALATEGPSSARMQALESVARQLSRGSDARARTKSRRLRPTGDRSVRSDRSSPPG
jgi:uncharacterized protein YbjT (DUF2867 family)